MKVNETTKRVLAIRRQRRDMVRRGYEEISCASGIGQLWQLDRGARTAWRLVDAVLGVDGKSVYVKAAPSADVPAPVSDPNTVRSRKLSVLTAREKAREARG